MNRLFTCSLHYNLIHRFCSNSAWINSTKNFYKTLIVSHTDQRWGLLYSNLYPYFLMYPINHVTCLWMFGLGRLYDMQGWEFRCSGLFILNKAYFVNDIIRISFRASHKPKVHTSNCRSLFPLPKNLYCLRKKVCTV